MVLPINHSDVDWRTAEAFAGFESAEAGTQDHHPRTRRCHDPYVLTRRRFAKP